MATAYSEYGYADTQPQCTVSYLWPAITAMVELGPGVRVLDVGCGNGYYASRCLELGCTVVGIDMSEQGIALARRTYAGARWEVLPADEAILTNLDEPPFDVVLSTEVVEHLYDPRAYARGCFAALKSGGALVCTTPYHGYLKNVAVAVAGKFDRHVNPLWDGGHIKFWSRDTLSRLLTEAGFTDLRFRGAGRLPYLWKSMVMVGIKPIAARG